MSLQDLVIRSQLQPPRSRRNILVRPRLQAQLEAALDSTLTILQAGTGYGKSTALALLARQDRPLFWYTITEPDRDPLLFLVHLLSAFREYGQAALDLLEANNGMVTPASLNPLLNDLTRDLGGEGLLILDDFHLVHQVKEIQDLLQKLVDYCPPCLHIILSTRQFPEFPAINRWRVKGLLTSIGVSDLAFTVDEIEVLFRDHYHRPITPQQAQALAVETEGWAIALQMVWQGLQSGIVRDLETTLQEFPSALDHLFEYLATEVLARQPSNIQHFLLTTAILRQMDGPVCNALLGTGGSAVILRQLFEMGLFVDMVGEESYRYQRLFHDFLLKQATKDTARLEELHQCAAAHYEQASHPEEGLHHLLRARQYLRAARLLEEIGPSLLDSGRLDSLKEWFAQVPSATLSGHPELELLAGDVDRLSASFEQALAHYRSAAGLFAARSDLLGQCRALRGQAQVHLDTVRPLQAAALLSDALHLLDPESHPQETSELLEQLAENKLNFGFPNQARELHQESLRIRQGASSTDIYLEARILLRTGRLSEARRLLESYHLDEPVPGKVRPQHFHREKQLLLSLLSSLQGDRASAEEYARQGIAIGEKIQSEFVEAVGVMRLGHAHQLGVGSPWGSAHREAALHCYQEAIEKVKPFRVPRVSLEPLWGLCRAFGYAGDLEAAETLAQQAIELSITEGDEWIGHLVRICMGASLALAGRPRAAIRWLKEAAEGLDRVQDRFGWSTAQMWLALNAWQQGEVETALRHLSALLPVASEEGYNFLLTRRTFLGLRDDQEAIPMLLEARRHGMEREYCTRLLAQVGNQGLDFHPGYTLWVRTLAPFEAWRGTTRISATEWKRGKARQLFQLLVNSRGQWLHREQIIDLLWPNLSPEAGIRDFKVALNAVNYAIEPRRPRSTPFYFILRREDTYGINPQALLITDAEEFALLAASKGMEGLKNAMALYVEDYLPDCRYADWSSLERDKLRQAYLAVAERLAHLHVQDGNWVEVLAVCQAALHRDRCWEPGYALSIQAHASLGNPSQALAVYQQCESVLRLELGLEPSPATQRLRQAISGGSRSDM